MRSLRRHLALNLLGVALMLISYEVFAAVSFTVLCWRHHLPLSPGLVRHGLQVCVWMLPRGAGLTLLYLAVMPLANRVDDWIAENVSVTVVLRAEPEIDEEGVWPPAPRREG